jgi:hypothetical protein
MYTIQLWFAVWCILFVFFENEHSVPVATVAPFSLPSPRSCLAVGFPVHPGLFNNGQCSKYFVQNFLAKSHQSSVKIFYFAHSNVGIYLFT